MTAVSKAPKKNYWPVHIFYGSDSRLNLYLAIDGGDGYLNSWIDKKKHRKGTKHLWQVTIYLQMPSLVVD